MEQRVLRSSAASDLDVLAVYEGDADPVLCIKIEDEGAEVSNQEPPIVDPLFGADDIKIEPADESDGTDQEENSAHTSIKDDEVEDEDDDDYYGTESDSDDSDWGKSKKLSKKKSVKKKKTKVLRQPKREKVNTQSSRHIEKKHNETPEEPDESDTDIFIKKFFPDIAEKLRGCSANNTQIYPKIIDTKKLGGKALNCFVCGKRFKDLITLENHLSNHPQRNFNVCNTCGSLGFSKCRTCAI